uniref:Nuclear pore complex NUP2/50/61 domain-containing protein n=1 Tax=Nomascus leucogenys TaxID=61853 RepID=A0A2I3H1G4_NOMLE
MAKRNAEKELTDRNWDQEDEAEEVGTFSVGSEEKAKRRNVGFESDSGGAFQGFKGLVVPSGGGWFPGFGSAVAEPKVAFGSLAANGPAALVGKKVSNPQTNGDSQQPSSSGLPSSKACVGNQLAALNCSVRDWIVKHVNTKPLCDLTPIFKDYEKYLANIEQQHENSGRNSESESNKAAAETQSPSLFGSTKLQQESAFLFHGNKTEDAPDKKVEVASEKKTDPSSLGATSASFNFGKKVDSSVLGSLSSVPLTGFSFSPGNSSLFGKDITQSKPVSSPFATKPLEGRAEGDSGECKGGDEEENDEPPKVVVTEVKEEDAFYSKKCKLFYKKDNEFKEKGIANQKTQLLVRADTNLGNRLLNVLIPPNMPCTPLLCSQPVTIILRTKDSPFDADTIVIKM